MIRPSETDRTELERIELKHLGWRATKAPDLHGQYVGGEGEDEHPRVMIIGEAPGAEEVMRKRPFVGPAGRVLRQLMEVARLSTTISPTVLEPNCWLTNVVKFRPPRNRTPFPAEIMSVRHLLREEWKAVGAPRVVIAVGGVALHAVLGKRESVLYTSGEPQQFYSLRSHVDVFLWPMIHPSYGLRNKSAQPMMERDWEHLGGWLRELW